MARDRGGWGWGEARACARAGMCVRAGACGTRAPERVGWEGGAHTVKKRWQKSHHVTNDMMFWTYDWFAGNNNFLY